MLCLVYDGSTTDRSSNPIQTQPNNPAHERNTKQLRPNKASQTEGPLLRVVGDMMASGLFSSLTTLDAAHMGLRCVAKKKGGKGKSPHALDEPNSKNTQPPPMDVANVSNNNTHDMA